MDERHRAGRNVMGRGAALVGIKLSVAAFATALPPDTGSAHEASAGHPHKTLLWDDWYQRLSDSGSYQTWMTLTTHRHGTGPYGLSWWDGPMSSALAAYNDSGQPGGQHTVYLNELPPQDWHDVHVSVAGVSIVDFGIRFYTLEYLGITYLLDEAYHYCGGPVTGGVFGDCDALHSRPNTWWYAEVLMDDDQHSGLYGNDWQRQATVAHELGHGIGLAHDGIGDGKCPATSGGKVPTVTIPVTVMDYDCLNQYVTNVPVAWDACGINHKYYDPNWGYAGC